MKKIIKIPGLNKEQIKSVIDKVVDNHKRKVFGLYDGDDIQQESWIIILEKIEMFNPAKCKEKNPEKALENWLNAVLSNRLRNLYRDKYLVFKNRDKNLISPMSLQNGKSDNLLSVFEKQDLETQDLLDNIIKELDPYLLDVLESLLSGENLCFYYRNKLSSKLKQVLPLYE